MLLVLENYLRAAFRADTWERVWRVVSVDMACWIVPSEFVEKNFSSLYRKLKGKKFKLVAL